MLNIFVRSYQFVIKIAYNFIVYPKQDLIAEENAITKIPSFLKKDNLSHPLIVTDNNLIKFGVLDELFGALKKTKIPYSVFSEIETNPKCIDAENGYKIYKQDNCDSLIAVGGGSPIDVAKMIGAKSVKPKKPVKKFLGLFKVMKKIPTLFAVPTTAGTGSEDTIAAVLIDETTNHKVPVADPCLFPRYAILDPNLTKGLPPFMTATTGMDALCHAIESYTNHSYCSKKELDLALKAIKLIYENIYEAYKDGNNLEARKNMQLAACYAGRSFSRGSVGYVHAIGHTMSALYKLGHGYTMAVLLPKVMKEYGTKAHKYLAEIADYIGIKGNDNAEKASALISWIEEANEKMGVKNEIKELKKEDIPQIVKWAYHEGVPLYPTPATWSKKDFNNFLNKLL